MNASEEESAEDAALRKFWEDALAEEEKVRDGNPLQVFGIKRVYFVSRSRGKGRTPRKYLREVELIGGYGANGNHAVVTDMPRGFLDRLPSEVIPEGMFPSDVSEWDYFLELFRKL